MREARVNPGNSLMLLRQAEGWARACDGHGGVRRSDSRAGSSEPCVPVGESGRWGQETLTQKRGLFVLFHGEPPS